MCRYALRLILVAAVTFSVGCATTWGPNGFKSTCWPNPKACGVTAIKDPETGKLKWDVYVDLDVFGSETFKIAKAWLDAGIGIPVMGTIEVAGTTAGNLIQGFLKNLDPGPANPANGT